ncbi:MAG: 4Fe-4S binding protein [Patescibacteria group bacterium]|nr:4Fe-4S binding protein [Patescibacteria group bacterium]
MLPYNFLGFKLKSPIWVASQCPMNPHTQEKHVELFENYVKNGAALVKTQMISNIKQRNGNPFHRVRMAYFENEGKPIGFCNLGRIEESMAYLDEGLSLIHKLKSLQVPVTANIAVHSRQFYNAKIWATLAKRIVAGGADIIEINLSCPNLRANLKIPGQDYGLTVDIVREIKRTVDHIPIIVKFTPDMNLSRLDRFTRGVINAGADGITVVNSPAAIAPPDIYHQGRPKFQGVSGYTYTAVHGPINIYLAYRFVTRIYQIMKEMKKKIELTATGGINKPEQIVELMMLGASTVELSSAILLQGYGFIEKCNNFLDKFMEKQGYTSYASMRGLSHKYIIGHLKVRYREVKARINYRKCTNCGACTRSLCLAWKKVGDKVLVDYEKCSGCGFCKLVCPVGARIVEEV